MNKEEEAIDIKGSLRANNVRSELRFRNT